MKNQFRLLGLLIALLWLAVPASAQTLIDNTTLSAAISTPNASTPQPATTVSIASVTCTGCTFGRETVLYVDLEVMQVTAGYTSGTTGIPVTRGAMGTRAAAHANASVVFVGPPARFHQSAGFPNGGDPPAGLCVPTSDYQGFRPWVNVSTGGVWVCDGNPLRWRVTYTQVRNDNSRALSRLRSLVPDQVLARLDTLFRW